MRFYRNILSQNWFISCFISFCPKSVHLLTMLFYRNISSQKLVHLPTVQIYRNILSQNWFTNLSCCFIVTFCPQNLFTYLTMLFYRNLLSQNLFTYLPCCFYRNILSQNLFTNLPCCFIVTFCHIIYSPTYHAVLSKHFFTKYVHLPTMLFYRNILSES